MFISSEEKLKKLLDKLNAKASNAIIVVEGKKDRDALESIGIRSDFFLLPENCGTQFLECGKSKIFCMNKNKRSLQDCAELIAQTHNQAILLLDQDKKGQELAKKLKISLQKEGVKTNTKLGEQILKIARQRTVESIRL